MEVRGDRVRIGVAGWAIPSAMSDRFPGEGSNLQRYARIFDAVEINSSFHRPHRRSTYERWAASVPPGFRFAVKLPKTITHERRLVDCADLIERFAGEVAGLGVALGALLVQLPPSLAYDEGVARDFFGSLQATIAAPIVCEPRHASWFDAQAEAALADRRIARVAADPARVAGAERPGGWTGLAYFRLHGSPQIYRSAYGAEAVARHAIDLHALAARGIESWTMFDNTASGAATGDALALRDLIAAGAA